MRERLCSLDRSVRQVGGRVTTAAHAGDVSSLRNEILNEFVVTSRRGVVHRCIPLMVPGVDVSVQFFYQKLHGGSPAIGHVPVGVGSKARPVADTGRCMDWIDCGPTERDRWKTRMVRVVTSPPTSRYLERRQGRVSAILQEHPHCA